MHASTQNQFLGWRALIPFVKHLSFYDKCSMTNSPPILRFAQSSFSLVRLNHIIFQPHGNPSKPSPGKFLLHSPWIQQKVKVWFWSAPVVGRPALIRLPWAAVAGCYTAYIIVNHYIRNKHFSCWLDESQLTHVRQSACVASLHLQTTFELIRSVSPLS